MVSDNKIQRAFRTHTIYKQNPLEKCFIFTIYQNYTLALIKEIVLFSMNTRIRLLGRLFILDSCDRATFQGLWVAYFDTWHLIY